MSDPITDHGLRRAFGLSGEAVMVLRCWWCGTEPDDAVEVVSFDGHRRRTVPIRWPHASDHEHSLSPPSPADLVHAGETAMSRIREELS